jgi:uncharacterized protein
MNYYALFYEVVDDFVARRTPFRQEHLRLANEARGCGEIVFAGALAEPADRALIVFHAADKATAEAFARHDPYVVNGLVKKWEVRPWNVVVGNEPQTSSVDPARGMILRRWSARTTEAQLPKYLEHFSKKVVPQLRGVPGYLGATVSTRRLESEVEIVVETTWRSLESIRAFAGPDLEAAVVPAEAAALLTRFDRRAQHSEIGITDYP